MGEIMRTLFVSILIAIVVSPNAEAAWASTGFVRFDVRMDNGMTYIYPKLPNGSLGWALGGNCQYSRLELRESGDRFNAPENGKRMYALLLTAKAQGLRVDLGYDDTDGPTCRLAQLFVEWPQ
jgi:hypothetical protein